jgi:hypothetical protein
MNNRIKFIVIALFLLASAVVEVNISASLSSSSSSDLAAATIEAPATASDESEESAKRAAIRAARIKALREKLSPEQSAVLDKILEAGKSGDLPAYNKAIEAFKKFKAGSHWSYIDA